jgi:crotonobetainyl-CoA:carnitine CoA-transferase CaiB-like acyl-CoA transferase
MTGPLSHIRVLDLTRVLAGPWATQNLGDLGADIIKLERPNVGDDSRAFGPPFVKDSAGQETSDSVYFLCANRNKKSVTIDIASAKGQEIIKRLVRESDVFVENYKTGTLKRYGLSYEELSIINPRLIYCSLTGFGQDGPDAHRPAYDLLLQGMAGLMSVTGEMDHLPGGGPQKVGIAISDILAGMYTALAISAAIVHRERTGKGQYIDISLLDSMVAFSSSLALSWLYAGELPKRWGTAHPHLVPYQAFSTLDGYIILAIGNDTQFANFCGAIGRPELAADDRFRLNSSRVRHREELVSLLALIMSKRTKGEWQRVFDAANVPYGPINNMKEVFEEPQVLYRELAVKMPHTRAGIVPTLANPMRLSETPIEYRMGPPVVGEHSDDILASLLGMNPEEISGLRDSGVI